MKRNDKVIVFFGSEEVGTIAETDNRTTAFQYSSSWQNNGFSISPLSLPLGSKLFFAERKPFDGLFGVFNDSLPDGWGRLITDRYLKRHKINPNEITPLDRLTLLGSERTGSLRYEPLTKTSLIKNSSDLDELFEETKKIMHDAGSDTAIDEFFVRGSSSNGARPKINLFMDASEWIVKFPSLFDSRDMGKMEFDYNTVAKHCGIEVSEYRLLKSNLTKGFFASRRFDRPAGQSHMVSVSGLLETSHREPALDYDHLFRLSWFLTRDVNELERVFNIMCFNVFAHNQDDHSKNFSFIYDVSNGRWKLSPAYDITFSSTSWNEESTTVGGKGKNITIEDLVELAKRYSLDEKQLFLQAKKIKDIVTEELGEYLNQ